MTAIALRNRLARRASSIYRASGHSAYYFARFKLRYDPFYPLLLIERLVPARARILDLGCAQGLLAAWLSAAQHCYCEGVWDSACPAPERIESYRGIDRDKAEIRRARQALGNSAELVVGDIAVEPLPVATMVVLLDVLHYLDYAAQMKLLGHVYAALPIDGFLLLRIGDSGSGARARISACVDSLVLRLRGYRKAKIYRRPLADWLVLLTALGYTVQEVARQRSLGYANVLLRAFPKPP